MQRQHTNRLLSLNLLSNSNGKVMRSIGKMAYSCLGAAFIFTVAQTAALPTTAYGSTFTEMAKLAPTNVFTDIETYGSSIAISGNTMVVGMPLSSTEAKEDYPGTAWVYAKGGDGKWKFQAVLTPPIFPDISSSNIPDVNYLGSGFGKAVAISGNLIVVGAPDYDGNGGYNGRGAVYIFKYSSSSKSWNFVDMIKGPSLGVTVYTPIADMDGAFGTSVAIDGSQLVVGAPNLNGGGLVYVYPQIPNSFHSYLPLIFSPNGTLPVGAANMQFFGSSVDVEGNKIVVGSPQYRTEKMGAVYVFTKTTGNYWHQEKIEGSESRFGTKVAIDGNNLAVTSMRSVVYNSSGLKEFAAGYLSMYKLKLTEFNWSLSAKLSVPFLLPDKPDRFGESLDLKGDTVIVGASKDGWTSQEAAKGAAYVFRCATTGICKGMWIQKAKLTTNDMDTIGHRQFGTSVALEKTTSNNITAVIGDPGLSTVYIQKGQ